MFKPTLSGKIALLVAIFIVGTSFLLTNGYLDQLESLMIQNIRARVAVIQNTLMPGIADSILKNELATLETISELVVKNDPNIVSIRIFNDEGRVLTEKSGAIGKVNRKFVSLIHIPETNVELGNLELVYNLDSSIAVRDRIRSSIYRTTVILVLISILVSTFLAKRLTVQLEELTRASQNLSRGDMNQKVSIRTRDEIGTLGEVFNQMVEDIRRAQNLLYRANEKLSAVYEVGRLINSAQSTREVIQLAWETLESGFGARAGAIYLDTSESGQFVLEEKFGLSAESSVPERLPSAIFADASEEIGIIPVSEVGEKSALSGIDEDALFIPLAAGEVTTGVILLLDYVEEGDPEFTRKLFRILSSLIAPAVLTARSLEHHESISNEPFRIFIDVLKPEFDRATDLGFPFTMIRFKVEGDNPITGDEVKDLRKRIKTSFKTCTNVIGIYPGELVAVLPGTAKKDIRGILLKGSLDQTANQNPVTTHFTSFPEDGTDLFELLIKLRG